MSADYNYPLDTEHWTTEEVIDVVNFYHLIEKANEDGVKKEDLMLSYNRFKQIVPSKSEEKTLGAEFERQSGYSIYKTVKLARNASDGDIVKV
ncbi:hypothetical protein N780_00240 [Pontibacillus chungwhensis BH030062]|uniref:Uncharacterized protein n=1 Tax=Pontibacillus chungwhensis BH030062 TaxID=1385513 RepID=A0A0A2UVU3_9BACI|nr:UPF0223 family protein [Pontibacillus chungwhensis]KGP92064.1 hypothetical protein N780_00240 [Pontibacillus chungwhensis BH030062]